MDINLISTLILGSASIIFMVLSLLFYKRDKLIKNNSIESVFGRVVSYSYTQMRSPVVEYIVDNKKYKKALRYSYISTVSTPFNPVDTSAKGDLLDTKLRLKENSTLSINTIMQDEFPLGSQMKVYYNPNKPKLGYVERYAPSYMWIMFLFIAILMLLLNVLFFYIIKK